MEVEMKIEKQHAIDLFRTQSGNDISNELNAMWFHMYTTTYRTSTTGKDTNSGLSRYLATDARNIGDALSNYGRTSSYNSSVEYVPALIIFAPEGADITAPTK